MSLRGIIDRLRRPVPRWPGQSPGQPAQRTDAEINADIVRLNEAGRSQREIVEELGVSKGRIYRVLTARKGGVRHGE